MSSDTEVNNSETETAFCQENESTELSVSNNVNDRFEINEENSVDSMDNSFHKVKRNKLKIIHNSDSEDECCPVVETVESDNENVIAAVDTFNEKKHKRLAIVDTDSEEDVSNHNKSFSDNIINSNEQPVFVINSEGNVIPENVNPGKYKSVTTILSSLCDPESSEDETNIEKKVEDTYLEEISAKQYKKKLKPKINGAQKSKKMTAKTAAKLRTEIKSESQRMMRERNISLPYHKPKSYTIKEFLSKRPKFSSAVPINEKIPPSVAIKMSTEQLTVVSKNLREREKRVKRFYKSESESDDDHNDKDSVPPFESEAVTNLESIMQVSETTRNVLGVIPDKMDNENCPILTLSEDVPLTAEAVENRVIEGEIINECANKINNVDSKDCGIVKDADSSNVLDDIMFERGLNQITDDSRKTDSSNKDNTLQEETNLIQGCVKGTEEDSALETDKRKEDHSTPDYEFNLDDIEENHESTLEKENLEKSKSKFEYTDLDREIENFGCDGNDKCPTKSVEEFKNLSKLEMIKHSMTNVKPKLTGSPNDMIDLETGTAKPNEVVKLMKRFMEHNFKKPLHKDKVELSIISCDSGEIHKETIAMKLEDSEVSVVEEKPGAKLQKLRGELQTQMAQKRSELWQKKATKQISTEETNLEEAEKEDCEMDDDILDDEEEEMEITESSEEEEEVEDEEEEEEMDCANRKKKSMFIDEEAEESDEEDHVAIKPASRDEEADEADDENEIDELSDCNANDEEVEQISHDMESETQPTNKTFRKILKGFTEDSDEEESVSQTADIKSNNENSDTLSQEDDDILPPQQPRSSLTPIRQITQKKSDYEFLTPISYITGLQNLNSASKNLKDSPPVISFKNLNEPSPLKEDNWQRNLQKKLFTDAEITNSQVEELYTGKFTDTQESEGLAVTNVEQVNDGCVERFPCTSNSSENEERLVELCSGKFPSTEQAIEKRMSDLTPSTQDLLNVCSGEFTGITQNGSQENAGKVTENSIDTYHLNANKEVKNLDEDQDLIISQLIDEEEMEKFKKRFESPLMSNTQRRIVEEFEEAVAGGGVIDSDDDNDTLGVKKKNKKRIMFSDDEDSEDESEEEEVIDLHDDIEDDVAPDNVAYDSEENEIELADSDGGVAMKPSDFFENEAELSESEWGSADEDEKDLDTMDFEQGDAEKYDEKKIRSDLEKIHMRQLLDDDTRQVKMLQEMLLEDGELHGTGRERQFKWRNIDSGTAADERKTEEDDIYLEEEESEEQWRKRRHEREMFLKDKLKRSQESNDDDLLSESQLLKIGQRVLQRSQSNSQGSTPVDKSGDGSGSPIIKQSFTLLSKRGSFLSRGDQVLQRLAEYSRTTSVTVGTATAKNSRNFLFQTVTTEQTSVSGKEDKKRKAVDGTPAAIKKLRLSNNLSPAVKKKPSTKTRLFSNW